ncbi:MAG: tRNA preQ1(34) S-adenosylmethionine ribosyltransferase-isomerase QueA [Rhodospirillales bacterium]
MRVSDFDFDLPPRFIAQRPAVPRDSARLLAVGREFRDLGVRDLPGLLAPGDVMVVNDTRVIPARLGGKRSGGGRVEVTLIKPEGGGAWQALAKPAGKLMTGERLSFAAGLSAEVAAKADGGQVTLRFPLADDELAATLEAHGIMPLPPYIKRGPAGDARDRDDYQTLFAERPGAVAAPTAGLHFTPALLAAIADRGVTVARLTLHVGAGTFLPVKAADTGDHRMHAEWGEIGEQAAAAVNAARARGARVVAVGSTALRLLETAAGADGRLEPFRGDTDIFITPGYRFRIVDALLTNFHLPRSTLFMLVAAFAGLARMKAAYDHAKANGYRFYSYGDACWLVRTRDGTGGR